MDLHRTLPAQNLLKGCVISHGTKNVNYYLYPTDWSKKADGVTASDLTGTDGNVCVRKTAPLYWRYETIGTIQRIKVSLLPLPGFVKSDIWNYSSYEGFKDASNKLCSFAGVLPTTSVSETNFRTYARANGAGYEQQWYSPYKELVYLLIMEYATNNIQKPVNANLTAQGYKQGGLGNGVTTAVDAEWNTYNGRNPFIICGTSDSLANGSGEVSAVITNFGGAGVNRTFTVPRYRGTENVFGHIWKWTDGCTINNLADRREAYIFDNPANFADGTSTGARLVGLLPTDTGGWIKTILFGANGDILPASVGGSSTTQFCDYFYAPALGGGWRALLCGGTARSSADAGVLCATVGNSAANPVTYIGSRLIIQ